jgi:AraC family cel operon transcriptional repressor
VKLYKETAKKIIDPNTEIHYAIHASYKNSKFPEVHNFYELLLIVTGSQAITINDNEIILQESSLLLIRPNDVHSKKYLEEGRHINLAFTKKTAAELFTFLGKGFPKTFLLESVVPPYVVLTTAEKATIQNRLESLTQMGIHGSDTIRTHMRILLFELFIKYFNYLAGLKREHEGTPDWLLAATAEMKKKENFIVGIAALIELSEKSHEYLCRSFKKYLHMTPTAFINEQRLNFAINLLLHSDMEIIDICFSAGFDNLSHFYHTFRKKFHTTPLEYRKSMLPSELI